MKRRLPRPVGETPHPLEPIVMDAFIRRPEHDGTSLGYYLAGQTTDARGRASSAYRTVALDVLGYMMDQGKLELTNRGWYVIKADK